MAAGLATLAVIERDGLADRADRVGAQIAGQLRQLAERYDYVAEVRGRGLMIGIEFGRPRALARRPTWYALRAARRGLFAQTVVAPLFQRHRIITQVAGDHIDVIKLLPPLVVDDAEVAWFLEAFDAVMADAHSGNRLVWDFGRHLVRHAVTR
jgi:4-aminobutyrate aminotransferase-like enzyme